MPSSDLAVKGQVRDDRSRIRSVLRFYKRHVRNDRENSAHHQRRRRLTSPLLKASDLQSTIEQLGSAFISILPPEVRMLIYEEVLKGHSSVIHVVKKPRKEMEFVRCKQDCIMEYNYRCSGGSEHDGSAETVTVGHDTYKGLLPLLQTCREIYTEAIDLLYERYQWDFRIFDAFIACSRTILPQRWNLIRRIHLQWHFGREQWTGIGNDSLTSNLTWGETWQIMSYMQGLQDIEVDLYAYSEDCSMTPNDEADVLSPLMAVQTAKKFMVKVFWPGTETTILPSPPFQLKRSRREREPRPDAHSSLNRVLDSEHIDAHSREPSFIRDID